VKFRLILAGFLLAGTAFVEGQNAGTSPQSARATLDQYCVTCHNERLNTANLALDKLDPSHMEQNSEIWEKVVRKLRAGMMPPQGSPRPNTVVYESLTSQIESDLDRIASLHPHLPTPAVHRLNRTEYANAIHEILGLEIDAATYLPADDSSYGFDNVVSGLQVSPTLVEAYVSAASKLSRLALGHETAPSRKTYYAREDYSQETQVEGLPFGTRGGLLARHYFPADGEYLVSWVPVRNTVGTLYGGDSPNEFVELTLDGARIKLYEIGKDIPLAANVQSDKNEVRISVKAGEHAVGLTFLANTLIPHPYLNRSYRRSVLDDNPIDGIMQSPQISQMTIQGPAAGAATGETTSRKKIFACTPASQAQETTCAKTILTSLARRAYRRPLATGDIDTLMSFYRSGSSAGFEQGLEKGVEFILAHPEFVFRTETVPAGVKPGESYRISDLELASRLSFFLWSNVPDDELLTLAAQGKLRDPLTLDRQVRRMLTDPRSHQLVRNFAGQWLNLRTLQSQTPEGTVYPDFDDNLRQAMRTESEMFFESIVREDRGLMELLTADYTFVNERLAAHYRIPNIYGPQFRRVSLQGDLDVRKGLLGKGSVLLATSNSDRTSPVLRGKWVLENILGTHPPDPPPNVPALKPNPAVGPQTMRQRMEEHRANPACANCHRMMDPIGFALENYDGTGRWRSKDAGRAVDAAGQLVDGTPIDGVITLRQALLSYSPQFARTVTEKLLTYALGRGVEYDDMPVVRSIVRESGKNNYRFSALITEIVRSAPFQMNRKPATTLTAGADGGTNRVHQ